MRKIRLNLTSLIFVGFILGIMVGLFFGEGCKVLEPVGKGFLLLLQMGVMPFIVCALISGIGKLSVHEALSMAKRVGVFILVLWVIAFVVIVCMAQTYPSIGGGPFFSKSMIEPMPEPDFLGMYIPSNPFKSLANTMIPAVVLFSILMGVALIGMKNKDAVISICSTVAEAMLRIMDMVLKLSPIGIFALTAVAAGTLGYEELDKLQVYFIGYLSFWVLLCFWVLPYIVSTLTPFTYRDVLGQYRDVLITAFATGNLFSVLPLMAQRSRELFEKHKIDGQKGNTAIDVVVGTSFNFPDLGKLFTLSFIPFAGWFVGRPLPLSEYPAFLSVGLFSFFGDVVMAMLFLLDLLHIPADTFTLFIVADVPISHFGTMLAAMHTQVLTLLSAASIIGVLRLSWARVGRVCVVSLGSILLLTVGLKVINAGVFTKQEDMKQTLLDMPLHGGKAENSTVVAKRTVLPDAAGEGSAIKRIRKSKVVRVGIGLDNIPFSYPGADREPVGFDVEMAQNLARDLGAKLVIVPIKPGQAAAKLASGEVDVVMISMALTPDRLRTMIFPTSHMESTAAFITKDHRRNEFAKRDTLLKTENLKIGVANLPYYEKKLRAFAPNAEIVVLDHPEEFFGRDDLDALFYSAESGSAWCMIHPSYTVVIPKSTLLGLPLGYPVAAGDRAMADFMVGWIKLKRTDGTIDKLYDHWIQGEGAKSKKPRWSIIRDVLHWVD